MIVRSEMVTYVTQRIRKLIRIAIYAGDSFDCNFSLSQFMKAMVLKELGIIQLCWTMHRPESSLN